MLGNQIKALFEPFVIVVEHNMKAIRWRLHLTVNHMFNGFFYNALTAKSELNNNAIKIQVQSGVCMTKEQILTIVAARQSTRKFHLVFNAQYLPYKKKSASKSRRFTQPHREAQYRSSCISS